MEGRLVGGGFRSHHIRRLMIPVTPTPFEHAPHHCTIDKHPYTNKHYDTVVRINISAEIRPGFAVSTLEITPLIKVESTIDSQQTDLPPLPWPPRKLLVVWFSEGTEF